MKTPLEILFERHRGIEARLNRVRRDVLAGLPASRMAKARELQLGMRRTIRAMLSKAWLELIWPSRRAWAGIAALWLVIGAVNLSTKASFQASTGIGVARGNEVAQGYEAQRRLLTELLPPERPVSPGQTSRSRVRPRSEALPTVKPC